MFELLQNGDHVVIYKDLDTGDRWVGTKKCGTAVFPPGTPIEILTHYLINNDLIDPKDIEGTVLDSPARMCGCGFHHKSSERCGPY